MQVGDFVHGGIYAGTVNNHHIICSLREYECPVTLDWYQANEFCKEAGMELPTKKELNLLYKLYKLRPEYFTNREYHWYWSSTESSPSPTTAWVQSFTGGTDYAFNKTSSNYVRAIKRIRIES